MLRNLVANLVLHERLETTDAKAKELRRVAERLITRARRLGPIAYTPLADLSPADRARRLAASRGIAETIPRFGVRSESGGATKRVDLVEKVLVELARRYENRPGGYTRIVKFGPRRGDNAPMSLIELVDEMGAASKQAAEPAARAKAESAAKATAAEPAAPVKAQ
jgi:large subunit ribosomal protein L17